MGKRLCFLLLNNLQTIYEWWGNGTFQGISTATWGRSKLGSSEPLSTGRLLQHLVHSPRGTWTPQCTGTLLLEAAKAPVP